MTSTPPPTLFTPFSVKSVTFANRIAMAPMTRSFSPEGIPGADVAAYYRRRAEGGVALIFTEGTHPPHDRAGFDPRVPHLYGAEALAGWKRVVEAVHSVTSSVTTGEPTTAKIFAQIWHLGMEAGNGRTSPLGLQPVGTGMSLSEIKEAIRAYGEAAANSKAAGFDGIELHGAHGYLIDQFLWEKTNERTDAYGGSLTKRARFAIEAIEAARAAVGPEYPISFRFSQWKSAGFEARLVQNPDELEALLKPLQAAGVDIFHASTRRFWEPEFDGSPLTLAAWTKKVTGAPVIAVGSVTLGDEFITSFRTNNSAPVTGIEPVSEGLDRGDFDMIAIGRSLIVNPDWPKLVQQGAMDQLKPFDRSALATLV